MELVPDGTIVAVASRSKERADAFAARFAIEAAYDDYGALAEDQEVDAVYVATPHTRHMSDTLVYLEAGKHVLCEKPLAMNAVQATQMARAAADRGLFLMEAMWSRFLPAYQVIRDILGTGRIGDALLVEADLGSRQAVVPTERLFNLAQGGGALLDRGPYPLQLCSLVLGPPDEVVAAGHLGATGVDEHVAAMLRFGGGALGVVQASLRIPMASTARIAGTDGWIDVPAFMNCPDHVTVVSPNGSERIEAPFGRGALRFEIMEVHRCTTGGLIESTTMPLGESIALAATMDRIRAQIGLVYPGETGPSDRSGWAEPDGVDSP